MISWFDLKYNYYNLNLLRKPHIQHKYDLHLKKYKNINQTIINKYLSDKLYTLIPNSFPYNIQSNIKHYVLFLHPKLHKNIIYNKFFIYHIIKSYIKNKPFLYYINPKKKQSIKNIPHYQVFIKN